MAWIWMAFKYQTLKRCWYSNGIWIPDLLLNLINGRFCHLNSGQIVSENVNVQISVVQYSNHLNTGLVWYSNGRFVSGCQMVWYSSVVLKTGLEVKWLYHLNTGWIWYSGVRYSDGYCIQMITVCQKSPGSYLRFQLLWTLMPRLLQI